MYTFEVFCSDKYPEEPPRIRIKGPKMAMKAVDASGYVNLSLLSPAFRWNPKMNIADALYAIRSNMGESGVANASFPLRNQNYF
jgi:ubiquitin-protein ligase